MESKEVFVGLEYDICVDTSYWEEMVDFITKLEEKGLFIDFTKNSSKDEFTSIKIGLIATSNDEFMEANKTLMRLIDKETFDEIDSYISKLQSI
jgi:hypothetical protein